jgi:2-oxoglutarate ferredoxin oxidoreductase subunit delta
MKYWRTPLDHDRMKIPRGEVHIIVDRCKGCGFCVEYCPKEVLVLSKEFNKKGYHPPEVVKEGECVNCNLCEMICPDFAIYSVAVSEEAEKAIHGGDGKARADQATATEPSEEIPLERGKATREGRK